VTRVKKSKQKSDFSMDAEPSFVLYRFRSLAAPKEIWVNSAAFRHHLLSSVGDADGDPIE
jgi:hypothetical protein